MSYRLLHHTKHDEHNCLPYIQYFRLSIVYELIPVQVKESIAIWILDTVGINFDRQNNLVDYELDGFFKCIHNYVDSSFYNLGDYDQT